MNNNTRALGDNRQNSSGNWAAVGPLGRTSIIYPIVVPANSVAPVPCAGTTFYVTVCTGPIDIRPYGGVFNTYTNGKGLKLKQENAFSSLEVRNTTSQPLVVQLFVGFDEFIDNALILANTGQTLVANPTYSTASSATNVNITDLSGGAFTDINGIEWYALQREAIYVSNLDSGVTLLLQQFGSIISNGPAVIAIFPTQNLRYAASGDYCLNVGGGNINALCSELYQSIPVLAS